MAKIDQVAKDVHVLRERLVEKIPARFSMGHIVTAFFGALFFGFTFVLKGLLFEVGLSLSNWDLFLIVLATLIILTAEIYFVGYQKVPVEHRKFRHFGQFWFKRIVTYYLISLFVALMLLYIYGITQLAATYMNMFKLVVAISFPAAIGAAASDLLGKY
ncbi:TIGR02587 family membrane protein [Candidatus Woesearchaeota archaeon]|nr:TIGR02587 family membrane protein [Candidatus Woesearchaeota archaeon]